MDEPKGKIITITRTVECYAAWFINRGIKAAEKYEQDKEGKDHRQVEKDKELCYMNYAKLHKLLYYTIGIALVEEPWFPILAKDEHIRAHECGAIIHSISNIASEFDYGQIKERIGNIGPFILPSVHVDIMERVYQALGHLDKRQIMRFCKKDGLWVRYIDAYNEIYNEKGLRADPNDFPEMKIEDIGEHFSKLRPNYFEPKPGLTETSDVVSFEVAGLKDDYGFKDLITKRELDPQPGILAELLQMRGYSNLSRDGKALYDKKVQDIGNRLAAHADNQDFIEIINSNYRAAIDPCVEHFKGVYGGSAMEYSFSRARNNIDALLELRQPA